MILYEKFIINQYLQRLDEHTLYYQEDFIDILTMMNNEGDLVAKTLLSFIARITDNKDTDINSVAVSDIEGFLEYVPDSKTTQKVKEEFPNSDKNLYNSFVRRDMASKIKTTKVKTGRLIQKLLSLSDIKFKPSEIEKFVNKFIAIQKISSGITFKILKENDIVSGYKKRNYSTLKGGGELYDSCMNNMEETVFDIYIQNPEVCSLLTLRDGENKIAGRALLWIDNKNRKIMDRVYTCKQSDEEIFRKWAKDNKYYCRKVNNNYSLSNAKMFVNPEGEDEVIDIIIQLQKSIFIFYPYLDTMKYLERSSNRISNSTYHYNDKYIILQSTDGGYDGIDGMGIIRTLNDGEVSESEALFSDYHNGYILKENAIKVLLSRGRTHSFDYVDKNVVFISKPDSNKNTTNEYAIVYSKHDDCYYFMKDTVWSKYYKSWISEFDSVHVEMINDNIYSEDELEATKDIIGKDNE